MNYINLGNIEALRSSVVAMGCYRIDALTTNEIENLIKVALDNGINFFDHADIYGGGECEILFGKAIDLKSSIRDKIIIQSKCGCVGKTEEHSAYYDFSKEYILKCVDASLKRLGTDYLDVLLLHWPDALSDPEEVAHTFDTLKISGKVRHFGLSNHNTMKIQLLQKYLKQKIVANQMRFSVIHSGLVGHSMLPNVNVDASIMRDGSVLDYCTLNDITIQAWSPFQYGNLEGTFVDSERYPELNKALEKVANRYNVTKTAVVVAWILRHPANMQVVVGTTNARRMAEIATSTSFALTRPEWYDIYQAAGNVLF